MKAWSEEKEYPIPAFVIRTASLVPIPSLSTTTINETTILFKSRYRSKGKKKRSYL
jgi:hypothetical protein